MSGSDGTSSISPCSRHTHPRVWMFVVAAAAAADSDVDCDGNFVDVQML